MILDGATIVSSANGSGSVWFEGGKRYKATITHSAWYTSNYNYYARLYWQSSTRAKQIVPTAYLYPADTPPRTGNQVRVTGAGPLILAASQSGNVTYNPATPVQRTFNLAAQTITFSNPGTRSGSFALGGTATSGLPITYAVIAGTGSIGQATGIFTPSGVGSVTVRATQGGDTNYDTAPAVEHTFTVTGAAQAITFPPIPNKNLGDAPFGLGATTSSGLPVTYSVSPANAGTVNNGVFTVSGLGTISVTASQAGGYNESTGEVYQAASTVTRTFTVAPMSARAGVAAGGGHTLAVKSDGTVWAWGTNTYYQLGDGTSAMRATPGPVSNLTGITAVAGGGLHNLALKSNGTVWAWGDNSGGAIGDGTWNNRSTPVQISITGVVAVAARSAHGSMALKADGTVWAWGTNNYGQVGDGTTQERNTPVKVSGLSNIVAIAGGGSHCLAVRGDGTVWAWGDNSNGQIGDGTTSQRLSPVQVMSLSGAVAVSAGSAHSLALKSDGTVWSWGRNSHGQLGNGTTAQRTTPGLVSNINGAVGVSSGVYFSLALKADGTVWGWGENGSGQLGDGTSIQRNLPVQSTVQGNILSIDAGSSHAVALRDDGTVLTWGSNQQGQLGDGTTAIQSIAAQLSDIGAVETAVTAGYYNMVLKADGTVWGWGSNSLGQIGDGTTINRTEATQATGTSGVIALAAVGHTLAVKSDATVWAWGGNSEGQLGDGSTTNRSSPVQVSNLSGVSGVAVGQYHSLAVKSDGTIWSWGANGMGQLGDGTNYRRLTRVQVNGLGNVVAVSAGQYFSLALKSDGTVWGWGDNYFGKLGDGTSTQRTTPVQATGLTAVTAVVAGSNHSLALKNDGTVWMWGMNASSTAAPVSGLSGIVALAAGSYHSLALRNDGTVWAWGTNSSGQLGDGTTVNRSSPVQVLGIDGIVRIAARDNSSLAVKSDGTIRGWGTTATGVSVGRIRTAIIRLISSPDDSDQDGQDDAWEMQFFGTLARDGSGDFDLDGVPDLQEFARSADPTQHDADGDHLTDFADTHPADYFNNEQPTIVVLGGNDQHVMADSFNPAPFDIAVWNSVGTTPLVDAPVEFLVESGGGQLAESNVGEPSLMSSLTRRTDQDGTVQSYYKQPGSAGVASVIRVAAGPASLSVQTESVSPTADSDSDGLADGWEQTHFGTLTQTATGDPDFDGQTNAQEFADGKNPRLFDAIGGTLPTGWQLVVKTPSAVFYGVSTSTWEIDSVSGP